MKYLLFFMFLTHISFGQEPTKKEIYKARDFLRKGNKAYEKGNYDDALIAYQKSTDSNNNYYKGLMNMGNAFFKKETYPEAENYYKQALDLAKTKSQIAKTSEALGDAYKVQKKVEEALKTYKKALLKNPTNDVLRQKYVALKQQQEKQNKDQQNKKKDENNKDQKEKNKDNKDNKDSKDKNKDKKGNKDKEQDQKGDNKKKDSENKKEEDKGNQKSNKEDQKPTKPKASKLSQQQIQQLLESMNNEEEKTQKKVQKAKQVKAKVKKNEKDW